MKENDFTTKDLSQTEAATVFRTKLHASEDFKEGFDLGIVWQLCQRKKRFCRTIEMRHLPDIKSMLDDQGRKYKIKDSHGGENYKRIIVHKAKRK